jgi:hypothetical protein
MKFDCGGAAGGKFSGWGVEILLHASHFVMFFLFRFNSLVFLLPLSSFSQLIRSGLGGGASDAAVGAEGQKLRSYCPP